MTIIVAVAITILSTIPVPEVKPLEDVPFFDKWVHFVMYGGLAMAVWLDLWRLRGRPSWSFAAATFVGASVLGGLLELVQAYLTTCRSGDWLDFWADAFGALLGTIISYIIWRIAKTSEAR